MDAALGLSWQLVKAPRLREWVSTLPQPQPQPHPDQAFPLPAWLGLNRRWSQVQADTQELQREGCLVRTMEIQSHGVCKKDKQIGRYLKGISATAYTQKPAANLTEHPERRHIPGGTGTAWLGGQSSGDGTWEG